MNRPPEPPPPPPPPPEKLPAAEVGTQQITIADVGTLAEVIKGIIAAASEPQERIRLKELTVEEREIDAEDRSERRWLIAGVVFVTLILGFAVVLVFRGRDELGVQLLERLLYVLLGALGGWGVAKAKQGGAPPEA